MVQKRTGTKIFHSNKKTAKFPKKLFGEYKMANNKDFQKYRKENYNETIQLQKMLKEKIQQESLQK